VNASSDPPRGASAQMRERLMAPVPAGNYVEFSRAKARENV
jgi:hypothetical protein